MSDTAPSSTSSFGIESAAASVLRQAADMDNLNKPLQAVALYTEGISLLMQVLKDTSDPEKRTKLRTRVEEYMKRAEKLKDHIQKQKKAGNFHQQIRIEANSLGHSYEIIFKPLIDEILTRVDIEDPYIKINHQLLNFVRFCEVLVKYGANLKQIRLKTLQEENGSALQSKCFENLTLSLKENGVSLLVEYSASLHDREIRFSSGWVIKIGRGLDFFKPVPKFSIGYCDYDMRPCHETIVDIIFTEHQ